MGLNYLVSFAAVLLIGVPAAAYQDEAANRGHLAGGPIAQHSGHQHPPETATQKPEPDATKPPPDSIQKTEPAGEMPAMPGMTHGEAGQQDHSAMDHAAMGHGMNMASMAMPGDDGDGMSHTRMASGTAWQPTSTPSHMWMWNPGDWMVMAHANLFLTYNQQGGPRGVGKFESMNWLMLMEQREAGPGTLMLRQMFSAEPLTAPHGGFPELFQTGETYRGRPLVDHQHPHDLFMELAAMYALPIGEHGSWFVYGGPVGEPALGPVAFMHRVSASELPVAPLTHHLLDSTHITAGVVSTGATFGPIKVEGSLFNGREPDENRATIDLAPLDSYSFRVGFAPSGNWAMQYSVGRLNEPEAAEPGDIVRQTASVMYNRPIEGGNWATTLAWGRNHKLTEGTSQNGYLLESTLNFFRRNYVYTRLELLDRDELFREDEIDELGPSLSGAAGEFHPQFRVGAYTFGGVRDVVQNETLQVGIGADVTFYSKPAALDSVYGDNPTSFHVFVRLRPGQMHH